MPLLWEHLLVFLLHAWNIGTLSFAYESHIHTLLMSIYNAMPFHPRRGPQCGFSGQLCAHPTKDEGLCPGEQSLIGVHDKPCGNCAQWEYPAYLPLNTSACFLYCIPLNTSACFLYYLPLNTSACFLYCLPPNTSACFLYFKLQVDCLWPIIHLL